MAMTLRGKSEPLVPAEINARVDVVTEWLGRVGRGGEDNWQADLNPVSMTVADAVLHSNLDVLRAIRQPLHEALGDLDHRRSHGYVLGLLNVVAWAIRRLEAAERGGAA